MVGRTPKNTVQDWIEAAQRTLIDEGISGLKVDRLAKRLGVTRGGLYHNFKDRDEFFEQIIRHWEERSEEHTFELQSLMRISYAVFGLKKKTTCILIH